MSQYFLMHKNNICGSLEIDSETGQLEAYKDYHTGMSPFLGNCDAKRMKKWWDIRAVPASRKMMQEVLRQSGCTNMESYLAKNLALSMTDAYWICPIDTNLTYENVRFQSFASFNDGRIPYHNATSYDLNASLGGQMEKYWDLNTTTPVLVKESYKYYGQQAMNEIFATIIHEQQETNIPFVKYSATKTRDNGIICRCEAFTNDSVEFVSALEVIEGAKTKNDKSLYENYIDICSKLGIDSNLMHDFMDYQTLTDFVISNTDEHLLNFGILRDSNTFEYIGPAPIFDSGNSMFYAESGIILTRAALLERKITSFYESEEKMLKNVRNKDIVDISLLPKRSDVIDLYVTAGIPEEKATTIATNYETKIDITKDFQKGLSISLYHERTKEKRLVDLDSSNRHCYDQMTKHKNTDVTFSMLCGLPGSGKTTKSKELIDSFLKRGYKEIDSKMLYPIEQAFKDSKYFVKESEPHKSITDTTKESSFVYISANDVRKEVAGQRNDDFVFYCIDKRIKIALDKGISVIYEATNIDKSTRQHYIELVGSVQKDLYLMNLNKNTQQESHIDNNMLNQMEYRLYQNPPSDIEGWTHIYEFGERPKIQYLEIDSQENDISHRIEDIDIADD